MVRGAPRGPGDRDTNVALSAGRTENGATNKRQPSRRVNATPNNNQTGEHSSPRV